MTATSFGISMNIMYAVASINQEGHRGLPKRGLWAHSHFMKDKAPIIVLIIVAIGLGVALIVVNSKARDEKDQADSSIKTLSNTVNIVQANLNEQQSVNRTLETNLAFTTADFSNKLAAREAQL